MRTDQENLAARFLLGRLSEEESRQIEEEYFANSRLFEEILAAENDLIDAYAMDRLSPEDRKSFESRLLLSAHQRRRVQFARTMIKYAAGRPFAAEDLAPVKDAKPVWLSALARLFSGKPVLAFSFSLAALLFFAGALWLVLDKPAREIAQTNEPAESRATESVPEPEQTAPIAAPDANQNPGTPSSTAPAAPPPKAYSSPTEAKKPDKTLTKPAPPVVFSLALAPGLTRAAGESRNFTVPPKTDFVRVRLNFEQNGFTAYHAALETVEGVQVWSGRRKAAKDATALEIMIPGKLLKKADYILTLNGINKEGVSERVEDYAFTIN